MIDPSYHHFYQRDDFLLAFVTFSLEGYSIGWIIPWHTNNCDSCNCGKPFVDSRSGRRLQIPYTPKRIVPFLPRVGYVWMRTFSRLVGYYDPMEDRNCKLSVFIRCDACFLHPGRAKEMATLQGISKASFIPKTIIKHLVCPSLHQRARERRIWYQLRKKRHVQSKLSVYQSRICWFGFVFTALSCRI